MTATSVRVPTLVLVSGWQYYRRVIVTPDEVGLQVTRDGMVCSHCATCQRRVREFSDVLGRKPLIEHEWRYLENAYWLFIKRDGAKDPIDRLSKALDIYIQVVRHG